MAEKALAVATQKNNAPSRRGERNILTFYEKLAVIRYYTTTNISRNKLSKLFNCCPTQIRRILERKEEYLQQYNSLNETDVSKMVDEMKSKRHKFEMSAISFILHEWVERCRQLRLSNAITNETLKETALKMAAILNLPSFRPSYRWLNRFRSKYGYHEKDLSCKTDSVDGELGVEDIIIEFKDSLPSFMQKEILAVTSTVTKMDGNVNDVYANKSDTFNICDALKNNNIDLTSSEDDLNVNEKAANTSVILNDIEPVIPINTSTQNSSDSEDTLFDVNDNAGTKILQHIIFPHLSVIHQFALENSDVTAIELISQLGVHMQKQAVQGAYKKLPPCPTTDDQILGSSQFDDIILIE